jgi:DNA-binding NtrC family response regulator
MGDGSVFVLLVDDDAALAAAAARSFESVGMRTVVALDTTPDANFLAFVTDLKRESHSCKLVRMLKNWKPGVPIVVMTAHPELLKDDISTMACKPLEIAKLCGAIRVRQVH